MNLAPIVLFVYNRPWHTEQTLNALALNNLADKSVLYLYCDGPKKDASEESLKKINEVRQLVKAKKWCKEVIVIENVINLGLANSVIKGVTEVIEKHGSAIVLEDDIITGTYFLKFMNEGLAAYKNDQQVFGISAFKYPSTNKIEKSTYFLPISSSWSYATWSNRWSKVNFDGKELLKEIDKKDLKKKINFGGYPFYEMLLNQVDNKVDSWAIRFYASMFLNNCMFLFPNTSLVQNIGFDASGVHCGEDEFFSSINVSNEEVKVVKQEIILNNKIVKLVKQSFELQNLLNNGLSHKKFELAKKGKHIFRKFFKK